MPVNEMIRRATVEDAPAIAAIHIAAWKAAYAGYLTWEFLDSISMEQRTASWRQQLAGTSATTLVFTKKEGPEAVMCGWVVYGRARDGDMDSTTVGEVYAIYLAPERWHKGIGRQLLTAAEAGLRSAGFTYCVVWALSENTTARAFYPACGFRADGASKLLDIGGTNVTELRFAKRLDREGN
ncbi:MAG: GNAT family N-acetyltransferase [Verrucomicrobiota bacterium]|nr:GNAT family N-acetyltransferase [Verrucomicrobiota bacterium]